MKNKKLKNDVATFENIRNDITTTSDLKVPVSYVFGKGTLKNIESFGNLSLAENSLKVDKALENVGELQNIWNHSHSQWIWRHLNLQYHSPYTNIRQISAEVSAKKQALNESKWKYVEAEIEIKKIEEELKKDDIAYWKEVDLKIKLAKHKEELSEGITYIEGAMKDILVLNQYYEQLKQKISNFSESDVEKMESKSHLKRSLVQSIRDVRQMGFISKGEQEYLENIGVNPMKLQGLLQSYVESEAKQESWDVSCLFEFVENLSEELIEIHKVDKKLMNLQGFSCKNLEEFSFSKKVALTNKKEK